MPPFRSLLVVDAEKFSHHPDAHLPDLHLEIREALDQACGLSGLGREWAAAHFQQSTGDGVLAVLPLDAMVPLIGEFGDRLQDVLEAAAPKLRARDLRLRLRVALHVGMVDDQTPVTAGISTATINVCRLLDSTPLRDALKQSDPGVTFAAVAVSSEAFEMFVSGGYTSLKPSLPRRCRSR